MKGSLGTWLGTWLGTRLGTWPQAMLLALAATIASAMAMVVTLARAGASPASAPSAAAGGFAHALHARALMDRGAPPVACAACHASGGKAPPRAALVDAFGKRPDHAACFGACHGGAPTRDEWDAAATAGEDAAARDPRARTCLACHAAADLAARRFALAPSAPPPGALTVTAAFSHARHQRYAAKPADKPAGKQTGKDAGKQTGKDAPRGDAACLPCHGGLTVEAGGPARPSAASCAAAACHDGKAAFAITERCTQCHREAPAGVYPVARPTARFSHRQHAAALADVDCRGCHRLGSGGVSVERAGHAACVSCHAADFGAARPVICGACHGSTEPWRPLRADRLPRETTEFGALLDHDRHALPCQRCHTLDTRERQLRLPRDHSACAGSACHRADGGPAPELSACAECHQLDLVTERDQQRARAPWSVRQRFDHQRHRQSASGAALPCQQCHSDVSGALGAMAAPAKRSCEACHDGQRAFSVTGTGCNRCHGGAR